MLVTNFKTVIDAIRLINNIPQFKNYTLWIIECIIYDDITNAQKKELSPSKSPNQNKGQCGCNQPP